MMVRVGFLLAGVLLACVGMQAQQVSAVPQTFSVATIKPSKADAAPVTQIRGNRFATEGTTFVDVFKYAFNVHPDEVVGGPGWLRTKRFDIVADPETEKRPSSDEMKAMVQRLLVERFHVLMHKEQRMLSVYALVKAGEPRELTKSKAEPGGIPVGGYSPSGELEVGNATMADFAKFLQRWVLDRPAVDHTGIAGRFDMVLRWTPDKSLVEGKPADAGQEGAALPGLFTAIKEQLGLKLQPLKANADVYVIESAEMPSED
jgi:uncharacterized protein (TIGR03435 family)